MININNIHVIFNENSPLETTAIKGLNLDIKEGEFVTVIGSNGSGKSTLLNTISGDVFPQQGNISIDGQDITPWSVAKRAGLIARVFQDPLAGSCANLTIAENMALAFGRGKKATLRSAVTSQNKHFFREQLSRLGLNLEDRLNDQIGLLSGGQRQAISLLMSSLQPAKLLLLDEHTAALDPKTAAFVIDLTKQIVEQGQLTTLMVTHSMQQALDIGTRTIMLHQGNIVFDVSGKERAGMEVKDLLELFQQRFEGQELVDDSLLLT